MKRILFVISTLAILSFIFGACATQHKCPAYGHYTEIPVSVEDNVAEL